MIKRKYCILATVLSVVLIGTAGCKKEPEFGAPMSLKMSGDGEFDPNLRLGLFSGAPVNADNVPFKVLQNGRIETEKELFWGYNQASSSSFVAYSPYNESFTGLESVSLDLPADQSSPEKMKNADIMLSVVSGNPSQAVVNFRMRHAMTALLFKFDNRTGDDIKRVEVSGVNMSAQINFVSGSVTAAGSNRWVVPMRASEGSDTFMFLYPPQDAKFMFDVTLDSGSNINVTFDRSCDTYPGMIVNVGTILLDDNMSPKNEVELKDVSVSSWDAAGLPGISGRANSRLYLSDFRGVEPDDKGFFTVNLRRAVVTAVNNINKYSSGVILEDSTLAIYAWLDEGQKIQVGNTIAGPVSGYIDKPSGAEFHISGLNLDNASIGKTDSLPCINGSFNSLKDSARIMEYRRMEFKNVELKDMFESDRAVFTQKGVEISVICPGISTVLAEGAVGDLIGFPVVTGEDISVMVYDESQFGDFQKSYLMNSFTGTTVEGLYDLSNSDNIECLSPVSEEESQLSVRKYEDYISMQITDTDKGVSFFSLLYYCTDEPLIGHVYGIMYSVIGGSQIEDFSCDMECVKKEDGKAWLVDAENNKGLILSL